MARIFHGQYCPDRKDGTRPGGDLCSRIGPNVSRVQRRRICGKIAGREGPIQVRQLPESGSRAVASRSHRNEETNRWLEAHQIRETVSIGSSLKFCLVACGEADVYPRFGPTMEWDTAAGDAILRAAGGLTTHPDGSVFVTEKRDTETLPSLPLGNPIAGNQKLPFNFH